MERRAQRWPVWLLLVGVAGLLPQPVVRDAEALLEAALLSVRRIVDPGAWNRGAAQAREAADSEAGRGGPDDLARLAELLAAAHARVLPPRNAGWQRDGRFCAMPVGRERGPTALLLASAGPLPPNEPVFHGRELIGFTPASPRSADARKVTPLLAKGMRVPACAGVPGEREARLIALGDGSDTLRVAFADGDVAIREGDLAWAIDSPREGAPADGAILRIVGGALLGRIVRGDAPEGGDRVDWRIAPLTPIATVAEVAVRLPPGFPAPADFLLVPLVVTPRRATPLDRRRDGLLLPAGREAGVGAGCAVAAGPLFVGRVVRSGWQQALVLTLRDPGLRVRVLLLRHGSASAWELETGAARARGAGDAEEIELAGAPPPADGVDDGDGAIVVTAPGSEGVPEGLLLGTLARDEHRRGGVVLRIAAPASDRLEEVVVHRPPGSWSER